MQTLWGTLLDMSNLTTARAPLSENQRNRKQPTHGNIVSDRKFAVAYKSTKQEGVNSDRKFAVAVKSTKQEAAEVAAE